MNKKAAILVAAGTGLALAALALFLSMGFRMFTVMSPSMGTTAPVGTLVVSHAADSYQVNDIVTFNRGSRVYTHRIVAQAADGRFTTRGDLNTVADSLPLSASDIIGKAVYVQPGLGWLLRGLPWIVVGFLLVSLLTLRKKLPRAWRWALRISGWTLVVGIVALWLRPWLNTDLLSFRPADDTGVLMHVVNTGLFPIDALGTRLTSGQDAVVHVTEQNEYGFYRFTPVPALTWIERLILFLICLVPMLGALLVKPDPLDERVDELGDANNGEAEENRSHRRLVTGLIIGSVVAAVFVMNTTMAHAAVTAKIKNSPDTVGTRTFFNCKNAETSLGAADTFVVYGLTPSGTSEADLSGNGRTGTYSSSVSTSTSYGCVNDTLKTSVTFNGNTCLYMGAAASQTNPSTFSIEVWFRTSTKSNGKFIGFGDSRNTTSDSNYDRQIYIDKDGRIVFGVYPGVVKEVYTASGKNYADNQWHHVVATLSSAGQFLYVDGALAMSTTSVTTAQSYTGYWKVGCGNLTNWQNAATAASGSSNLDYSGPSHFTGQIQFAAVYTKVLTAAQVKEHYQAGMS